MKKCASCGREFKVESDYLNFTKRWRVCSMKNLWFNCLCGSTLMVPKGKYDWYSPDKAMSEQAASVFNRLALKDMPYIPSGIMQIQQLLADDKTTNQQLSDEVKKEPLVATEVLRIANNLKISGSEINSIQHAITFVGRTTVNDIVLTAVLKTFKFKSKKFTQSDFWKESFAAAAIAERLAKKYAPTLNSDEVYLGAYLSNLGKIVAAITMPEKTDAVHELCHDAANPMSWGAAEKQVGAFDHIVLGEIGAVFWGLPEFVQIAATTHHTAAVAEGTPIGLKDIVALAVQLAHLVADQAYRVDVAVLEMAKKRFGIADDRLLAIVAKLKSDGLEEPRAAG